MIDFNFLNELAAELYPDENIDFLDELAAEIYE